MQSERTTVEPLTPRQREVLDLLVEGRTNPEIAQRLGISLDGAKWHVREVLARLEVSSREEAGDYWRRQRSPMRRATAWIAPLLAGIGGKAAVFGGAAVVAAAVVGAALVFGGDEDQQPVTGDLTPSPTGTPGAVVDDFAPASGIPIVDKVIAIAKAGDLPAFRALMKEFPEPCTNGRPGLSGPPPCPAGVTDGSPVNTFRALDESPGQPGPNLDQLLGNFVPKLTTLHGAANAQPDTYNGFFPSWKYEVIVYGHPGASQVWAAYLLDDTGIVGVLTGVGFVVSERAKSIPDSDWLVAPYSLARIKAVRDLYVLGRDTQIRFDTLLPPVCMGKPFGIQLFGYPDPGVEGGIQVLNEPGLSSVLRVSAWTGQSASFNLPATASGPIVVRPGLHSSCLSDVAVQGEIDIALLAPPEDADVATFEFSGKLLDFVVQGGLTGVIQTVAQALGGELTASVEGYACDTASLTEPGSRNVRGNAVFRVGLAGQPQVCRAPGAEIVFVLTATGDPANPSALSERPLFVPGAIQFLQNAALEPPHRAPRAPLKNDD